MKHIWKFIVISLFYFLLTCCNQPKQDVYYKVYLNIQEPQLFESYAFQEYYEVKEDESFILPVLNSSDIVNLYQETSSENIKELIQTTYMINYSGWFDEQNNLLNNEVVITEDTQITLGYSYTTETKKVKFNLNDGLLNELPSINDGKLVLPDAVKENSIFQGWYTNASFISDKQVEIDFNEFDKQLNLYAKFTIDPEYVINLISQLPDSPMIDDIEQIKLVQREYNRLGLSDREKITNYAKLKGLYQKLSDLELAKEFYDKINDLYAQEVTVNLRDDIEEIEELLTQITDEHYLLMPQIDLNRFYEIIEEIEAILVIYQEDAKAFDKAVISIPIFMEQYYEQEIKILYENYQTFDDTLKAIITSTHKLNRLYQNLLEMEASDETIYYLNPETTKVAYLSKEQLCEGFFTDFYYYIVSYHGTSHLEKNNLYDVYDFVELSQDFTGAGANNLYGIGNIAGRYLLEKDINGILENQTDNAFFGFCYQNGMYKDVLPFFINFFAYWRIDEKYANTSNYGADIFAESWAPTVDIAKFFYYNEETSYVKTERMIDCLTNTASVVYGLEDDILNIRMRGYKFMGWYDNPEFSGSPITDLSKYSKVYAKWEIDEQQQAQDAANLVDVYIYNLTTKKAVVNVTTVTYVKNMYNNLTEYGKSLVKNYSTLQEYIRNNQ